jgi:tight adherence protein B
MIAALLVFLLVTGTIVGGYVAVSSLPGLIKQRRLDRRIREITVPIEQKVGGDSVVLKAEPDRLLDRMAASTRGGAWLSHLIEQSGVKTTPGKVILMSLGAAAIGGLLGAVLARSSWVAPITATLGLVLPTIFLMRKRTVRMRKFEEMFPEALDLLSRAVKAGHAFQTAMNMAAEELPDPVGPEFRKTFDQQNFGLPLREALNAMADRIPIIDVKFFVTAVLIQRETGGNLSEILDNLSHVVRERFKVLRQVRVHTAHGRFTGWVLMALPASLAMVMAYINPEHMQLLFEETMGRQMLMAAVVMQTIGYFWIQRVIKIEV